MEDGRSPRPLLTQFDRLPVAAPAGVERVGISGAGWVPTGAAPRAFWGEFQRAVGLTVMGRKACWEPCQFPGPSLPR